MFTIAFLVSQVMVPGIISPLLLSALLWFVAASMCPTGKQFLHSELQRCVNCTVCDFDKSMVVIRPCEVHQDTVCGPLSKLQYFTTVNPHRHKHHLQKYSHRNRNSWNSHHGGGGDSSAVRVDSAGFAEGEALSSADSDVPFSNVETLVWDWQAIALTLAVFSCILFFLVITLYSLHQARQWRRLKENFEAGKRAFLLLLVPDATFSKVTCIT